MPPTLYLQAKRPEDIQRAAEILRGGGLVAFPTETVYGLGANALSFRAVEKIFAAKQRPAWDPLIVHIADAAEMGGVAQASAGFEERVQVLAEAFWPGPLTMLLPRRREIPDGVTAGRGTVGVRVPAHPAAQALLRATARPLAAPSANRFGHVSPTSAQHVLDDLAGRIDAVLDGGATTVGLESTVLDVERTPMRVYRSGAITPEMIRFVTGLAVEIFQPTHEVLGKEPQALPSPGVGIRHYAPGVPVWLSGPSAESLAAEVRGRRGSGGGLLGVLLPEGWEIERADELAVERWAVWGDDRALAARLFAGLRALEDQGVTGMVCPLPEPGGLRDALRDRLLKAAKTR